LYLDVHVPAFIAADHVFPFCRERTRGLGVDASIGRWDWKCMGLLELLERETGL
jgi:hypothetical protein